MKAAAGVCRRMPAVSTLLLSSTYSPGAACCRCACNRLLPILLPHRPLAQRSTTTRATMSASDGAPTPGLKPPPKPASAGGDNDGSHDAAARGTPAPARDGGDGAAEPGAGGRPGAGRTTQKKSHSSALCVIPDRRVWAQLQEVRCFKDKGFVRWPPHANLLYPFLDDSGGAFEAAARTAATALQGMKPFEVTLSTFKHFSHGHSSATLWLDPQCAELKHLQEALVAAFPSCTDLSGDPDRGITEFVPHFSLGQWRSAADAEAAAQELAADWQPISFTVSAVQLISRSGYHEPFRIRWEVPLGGAAEPAEVNVPYVATAGDTVAPPGSLAAQYGIGAQEVNYFAFGANISPKKLTGSRNITPLESHAARIPGWRLAYNHRGAMGNLMPVAEGEGVPSGMDAVHGVVHRLKPADFAKLTNMEHEYRPLELTAQLYEGGTVPCIAFVSPDHRRIQEGLPPSERYLDLLRTGAREWPLDEEWCRWLEATPSVHGRERDQRYYTSAIDGSHMAALPKIRVGSEQNRRGGRGGGRGRGRGGGGRGGGRGRRGGD